MVERMADMPPGTVGFRVGGEVERDDYRDVLVPERFDRGVRHHDAWVRSAIVTDVDWMARATRLFAWMIPGEARVLELAELEAAKVWSAGG
jgi:hypothetical protein